MIASIDDAMELIGELDIKIDRLEFENRKLLELLGSLDRKLMTDGIDTVKQYWHEQINAKLKPQDVNTSGQVSTDCGDNTCDDCWWREGNLCYLEPVTRGPDGRSMKKAERRCDEYVSKRDLMKKIFDGQVSTIPGICLSCGGMGCDTTVNPGDPPGDCKDCNGTGRSKETTGQVSANQDGCPWCGSKDKLQRLQIVTGGGAFEARCFNEWHESLKETTEEAEIEQLKAEKEEKG